MSYRRKDATFNARLAVRHDELRLELRRAEVTVNGQGQVVISAIPYLTFPSTDCAAQFVKRILMQSERRVK